MDEPRICIECGSVRFSRHIIRRWPLLLLTRRSSSIFIGPRRHGHSGIWRVFVLEPWLDGRMAGQLHTLLGCWMINWPASLCFAIMMRILCIKQSNMVEFAKRPTDRRQYWLCSGRKKKIIPPEQCQPIWAGGSAGQRMGNGFSTLPLSMDFERETC